MTKRTTYEKNIYSRRRAGSVAGCADLPKYTAVDSNASAKTRMRACMVSEANAKFQAGTLLTKGHQRYGR